MLVFARNALCRACCISILLLISACSQISPPQETSSSITIELPDENLPNGIVRLPAPQGDWIANFDSSSDSLELENSNGQSFSLFPPGSKIGVVEWSPNGLYLLVTQNHSLHYEENSMPSAQYPLQIWKVRVLELEPEPPQLLFQSSAESVEVDYFVVQAQFGTWSPDGRHVSLWIGPTASSIRADGLPLWVLNVEAGNSTLIAERNLLNPSYQSWAPDSSMLAFVAGGNRSAQVNKWLNLYDVNSGQITTMISKTEQIPGIVAWSPTGNQIAYAAVSAEFTNDEWAWLMTFENPAIEARRIYLLDPATGDYERLNDIDAFQDGPLWNTEGTKLYYVQRYDDILTLAVADQNTGESEMLLEEIQYPLPERVGYYGQTDWTEFWELIPE